MGVKEDIKEHFRRGSTYGTTTGQPQKMGQPQKNRNGTSKKLSCRLSYGLSHKKAM